MTRTERQLREDVAFLLDRAGCANHFSMIEDNRSTGVSSNALVLFAYTGRLPRGEAPSDRSDLIACARAWGLLPEHRRKPLVGAQLARWTKAIIREWGDEKETIWRVNAAISWGEREAAKRGARA